jgi:signal transduction histidine kinase
MSVALSADVLGEWMAVRRDAAPVPPVGYRVREAADTGQVLDHVTRAGGATGRPIVLAERGLPYFNPAAPDDESQRTILADTTGARVTVLLVSGAGGVPATPRANDTRDPPAPPRVEPVAAWRTQVLAPPANPGALAAGIHGQPVVRAHTGVPGTPFVLVRERDAAELLARLAPALMVSDVILSVLALLGVGLLLVWWRGAALRHERDAMALRSAFAASMSHELRTPLTQIRMYAEMLRHGLLHSGTETDRALDVIARESGRLGVLVDRALAFAARGARGEPAPAADTAVGDATARATTTLAPMLAERRVTVRATIPDDARVTLEGDALHQVLLNLLDNALKYGPDGQTIAVTATPQGARVVVHVDDEGPGIPPRDRERLFAPFVRGTNAGDATGSGIGLAIVRDVVRGVGGTVRAEDPPTGRGARLTVTLPAALSH